MSSESTFLLGMAMIIFMKIVVFVLGFLTIKMGYNLISAGASGKFKFKAELGGFKADLASVSPGLLFVLLGVGLIAIAVYVEKSIDIVPKEESKTEIPIGPPPKKGLTPS